MGTISVSLPADGTGADVADYNTPITTIVNTINGNLDSNNLAANAVTGAKIADGSISYTKFDADAVINGRFMRIYKNTTQNITQNTQAIIQFNAATAGYDVNLFELNSYGVKILYDRVKSVTVTLNTQLAAAQSFILYVFNNTIQQSALKIPTNESGQSASITLLVSQNDIITGRIYDLTANGQITAAGDWNFMTVVVNTAD